ncbi:DUF4142 domain-containing protein [Chryseobacterium sp. CT-SW4]|uniref:DUF4142 domain-containing protein n=1 Tax=Chryseobacterium sp. SW-1 TaxID=3157343 RepID=UPI003B02DCB3
MKKSILALWALAAMTACKKSETTTMEQTVDSTTVITNVDSGSVMTDSAAASGAVTDTVNALSNQDKKFADAAARGGMMEVMMGKLASGNATQAAVKTLGEMMVKDHTKANDELKKWASSAGYTLPTDLDADKQKKYDDLKAKKGVEFDRMYADLMVSDHKKDIDEFKEQASDGKNEALRNFARTTIPTLEHHLAEAEKTKKTLK